ncbi:HlyU family transcriptional regulator [Ahrensia sp. 13_GOM-1096m]|uniref:HlyU family transcriptional regulator n=1 Tax=Ahrensia sp. 13_GOM-1096m TaxID=1380380 RepID=UPI00047C52E4|nr:HlyU family transcriptional regulator [Ahrensia sp. 13_GOM-1096m]
MAGFLKRLFGGGEDKTSNPADLQPNEVYKDVEIRANPIKDSSGQWRVAGMITKNIDGVSASRKFIRADLVQNQDEAIAASVNKAKMIIDQNGPSLWYGDDSQPV